MEKPENYAGLRSQRLFERTIIHPNNGSAEQLFSRTMFFRYGTVIYNTNEKKNRQPEKISSAEFFFSSRSSSYLPSMVGYLFINYKLSMHDSKK